MRKLSTAISALVLADDSRYSACANSCFCALVMPPRGPFSPPMYDALGRGSFHSASSGTREPAARHLPSFGTSRGCASVVNTKSSRLIRSGGEKSR